jgi:hypothetical protein
MLNKEHLSFIPLPETCVRNQSLWAFFTLAQSSASFQPYECARPRSPLPQASGSARALPSSIGLSDQVDKHNAANTLVGWMDFKDVLNVLLIGSSLF